MSNSADLTFNLHVIDWQAVASIVSVFALLCNTALIYSIVVSMKGVQESRLAKESQILIWALESVNKIRPTMNDIKRRYGNVEWMEDNRAEILEVIGTLQMISYFALEDIIPRDRIADIWGKGIVEQWTYLESFVRQFRQSTGESEELSTGAFYARSFERFAQYARAYLDSKFKTNWPPVD